MSEFETIPSNRASPDLEVLGARYELVSIDGKPTKMIGFWTMEKIGLALALFCALLALIFAKINS